MALAENYDALLLDLDGTVWAGGEAIPGAVEAIRHSGLQDAYVTNNASRNPAVVRDMLCAIGLDPAVKRIVTSAQASVALAAQSLRAGDPVLVLGVDSLKDLVRDAGFRPVRSADDDPRAVIHGHNPETGWAQLSEAALAIRKGAAYIATNLDSTLPVQRGLMVGNGSMVAAVTSATGVRPRSAGKPEPTMYQLAARELAAKHPLAVGDRLDTDIRGANAAGMATLMVLSGVSGMADLLRATPEERPTYIAEDMSGLAADPVELIPGPQGGFHAEVVPMDDAADGDRAPAAAVMLSGGSAHATPTQALRTVAAAAWQYSGVVTEVNASGSYAERAQRRWHD